jgi:hypothetical protein
MRLEWRILTSISHVGSRMMNLVGHESADPMDCLVIKRILQLGDSELDLSHRCKRPESKPAYTAVFGCV